MNKEQFLAVIADKIKILPQNDIQRSLDYYGELIDDNIENGFTPEQAVKSMGPIDEIVSQILAEAPQSASPCVENIRIRQKRPLRAWEILLLILGAPLWIPLLAAILIILVSVYIVIWSVVIVCYAADLTFAAGSITGILSGIVNLFIGNFMQVLLLIGAGLVCAGLAILCFLVCSKIARYVIKLGIILLRWIKSWFVRKGN